MEERSSSARKTAKHIMGTSGEGVEQLRADNEWLVKLVEASPLAIVALDGERRYVALSASAEALHGGRSQDEMLGHRADSLMDEPRAIEFVRLFEEAQAEGFARQRVAIRGEDGISRHITALLSRGVAPGIYLAVNLESVDRAEPVSRADDSRKSVVVGGPDELSTAIISAECEDSEVLKIAAECTGPSQLVEAVGEFHPEIVIVATSPFQPDASSNGFASIVEQVSSVIDQAREDGLETRVLAIIHEARPDVALDLLSAGALGVIGPDEEKLTFGQAASSVISGERYVSPLLAASME